MTKKILNAPVPFLWLHKKLPGNYYFITLYIIINHRVFMNLNIIWSYEACCFYCLHALYCFMYIHTSLYNSYFLYCLQIWHFKFPHCCNKSILLLILLCFHWFFVTSTGWSICYNIGRFLPGVQPSISLTL